MDFSVVVAGGAAPPAAWAFTRLGQARWVFAADSGLRLCRECGRMPDQLVGDLDSLEVEEWEGLDFPLGVHRYPCEKDESDLHLCLRHLAQHWKGRVEILAALGGRLDHCLFNLCSVLFLAGELGLEARIVDPDTEVRLLEPPGLELEGYAGFHCSLLPLSSQLGGVHLQGFQYGLKGEDLLRRQTRGLSNRVEGERAQIVLENGEGLVILTRPSP